MAAALGVGALHCQQMSARSRGTGAFDAVTLKQRTFLGSIVVGDVSISGNP